MIPDLPAVSTWWLVFSETSKWPWAQWIPGRFKHVAALGWVPESRSWVFYDYRYDRSVMAPVPACPWADRLIGDFIHGHEVVGMKPGPGWGPGLRYRFGFFCVPAVKHLIGLRSGALLPDALWRDCLRNGGIRLNGTKQIIAAAPAI